MKRIATYRTMPIPGGILLSVLLLFLVTVLATCQTQKAINESPDIPEDPETEEAVAESFPIIAWRGISILQAKDYFGPMKECGIDIYLDFNYQSIQEVKTMLDYAKEAGVKLIIQHSLDDMESDVPQIMNHPALYAYYIKDEPETWLFERLAEIVKKVQSIDSTHPCYINHYPNYYEEWMKEGYANVLKRFLDLVPVPFLSFDHYPVTLDGDIRSLRASWYSNLEDIRNLSRAKNIPFWAFALTTCHKNYDIFYPVPTVGELRLQHFSNLVYGAQAFQYFTFLGIYNYSPTEVYARVKMVNEELQALAFIFKDADVKNVWHTGTSIPSGTHPLDSMPAGVLDIQSGEAGLVVSQVEKKGKTYIALVNKDFQGQQTITVKLAGDYKRYNRKGKEQANSGRESTVILDPADITVYEIL